ncbi:uncharacterized protein KY384_002987 [Bacidia gigantensis]|uniref:uncharacterized protein n=1 Tax=Bacidia gigantensis TaxID=2732470 RepID=UPI001D05983A|nr:uncharacterized protein KY384_002987 [Bacidia gigantensis]KAG8531358.1 hypothetical protein KY384_002987 [Bacidia gigantensis]
MATAAALTQGKKDWLVILPDREGALDKRMEHFDELPPKIESGFMKVGGALLEQPEKDGESLKIEGSFMLVRADTKEEALDQLKADIYTTSGVWDMEQMKIYPVGLTETQPVLTEADLLVQVKTAFIKP